MSVRVVSFVFVTSSDIKCQEMSRVKSLDKFWKYLCFRSSCLYDGLYLCLSSSCFGHALKFCHKTLLSLLQAALHHQTLGKGSLCTLLSWMQRVSNDFEWQIVLWTVCWVCWLGDINIPVEKVRKTLELVVESLFVWEKIAGNQSDTVRYCSRVCPGRAGRSGSVRSGSGFFLSGPGCCGLYTLFRKLPSPACPEIDILQSFWFFCRLCGRPVSIGYVLPPMC